MAPAAAQHDDSETPLPTAAVMDVFHDDHAINDQGDDDDDDDAEDLIADGFRPAVSDLSPTLHPQQPRQPQAQSQLPLTAAAPDVIRTRIDPGIGRRSSIRKSMSGIENPFASVEDHDDEDHTPSPTRFASYPSVRPLSSASSNLYAQTHSMHIDSSGPSHPYSMYPQGTDLDRAASMTSAPAGRAPRRSLNNGQETQPSHPYAMYPQGVPEDDDDDDLDDHDSSDRSARHRNPVPIGFPGSLRNMTRDTDNISIFTNSEQLPPYSEYPENAVPKPADSPVSAEILEPQAPSQAHVPLLINIPPQSMSDARQSSHDAPQVTDRLLDDQPVTPIAWRDKTWKQKRKTKFCGVKFNRILWVIGIAIFIVTVIGSTIGGWIARGQARRAKWWQGHQAAANGPNQVGWNQSHWNGTAWNNGPGELENGGALYDAEPITHVREPALPTGEFDLNLGPPEEVQDDCLPEAQAAAWDCNLFDAETLTIQVNNVSNSQGAFVYPKDSTGYGFGTQVPSTVLSIINLVKDIDSPESGNAYLFQVLYNKLVILSESAFDANSMGYQAKREVPAAKRLQRRDLLAGERPWFCYWNGTMLEGFVYLDEQKSERQAQSDTPSSTTAGTTPTACKHHDDNEEEAPDSKSTSCPTPEEHLANTINSNTYPGNIKLEERRIAGSPSPYCTQMQILDNGVASPVEDPNSGHPVNILLQENDPSAAAYNSASFISSTGKSRRKSKRGLVTGSCHCQWFSV